MTTPNNSVAIFSLQHKQRIYNGKVGDISLEGAKLFVDIPGKLEKGAILCHITLTLYYRLSSIVQTVLTIPEAEIIWSNFEKEVTNTVGIKYILSENNLNALSNYIEFRSIEESSKK